jgi:hypothetical protein
MNGHISSSSANSFITLSRSSISVAYKQQLNIYMNRSLRQMGEQIRDLRYDRCLSEMAKMVRETAIIELSKDYLVDSQLDGDNLF